MKTILKELLTTLFLMCEITLFAQTKENPISISRILTYSPRQIESLDTFYITGRVGKSFSLGIKWFTLLDTRNKDLSIQVTTEQKSLPKIDSVIITRVRFYNQISLNDHIVIVLIETNK